MKPSSFLLLLNHMLVTSGTDFVNLTKILVVEAKVVLMHVIKASRGVVELWLLSFLTSALDGGEWSASCLRCFTPRDRVHCICQKGSWLCTRISLDILERRKISFLSHDLNPDHPVHSPVTESLYWICCPSSNNSGKFYEVCSFSWGILLMCFMSFCHLTDLGFINAVV